MNGAGSLSASGRGALANVRYSDYTGSLVSEAFRAGLIDRDCRERLKNEMAEILRDNIRRYSPASVSVPEDTASEMIRSVLFCLDAFLLKKTPESALALLKEESLSSLYYSGIRLVRSYVYKCAGLTLCIRRLGKMPDCPEYEKTLDTGIRSILSGYDIFFGAHKLPSTPDYRTLVMPTRLTGIFFLLRYLHNLYCETAFCASFDPGDLQKVWSSPDRAVGNIFFPALCVSVASILGGTKKPTLIPSESVLKKAAAGIRKLSEAERTRALAGAVSAAVSGQGPFAAEYIRKSAEKYAAPIISAIRSGDPFAVRLPAPRA